MIQPTFEGDAFAQKGGNKYLGGYKKTYDRKFWKTKKCFKFDKEGHPDSRCPEGNIKDSKKNKSNDDNSRSSRSSKSSKYDIKKIKFK